MIKLNLLNHGWGISYKNCPQTNVTWYYWWYVNIGSGNSLVSSDNNPLPEPMLLTHTFNYITSIYYITRPQWFGAICRERSICLHHGKHFQSMVSNIFSSFALLVNDWVLMYLRIDTHTLLTIMGPSTTITYHSILIELYHASGKQC